MRKLDFFDQIKLFFRPPNGFTITLSLLSVLAFAFLSSWLKIIGIVPFLPALYFLNEKYKVYLLNYHIIQVGHKAKGKIVKKKVVRDDDSTIQTVLFEYQYQVENQLHSHRESISRHYKSPLPELGDAVLIYYLPENPREHIVPEFFRIKSPDADVD